MEHGSAIQHTPFFQQNPLLGYILILILGVAGSVLPDVSQTHIPPIVLETLQCIVWVTGSLVGLFTLIGMAKKLVGDNQTGKK